MDNLTLEYIADANDLNPGLRSFAPTEYFMDEDGIFYEQAFNDIEPVPCMSHREKELKSYLYETI